MKTMMGAVLVALAAAGVDAPLDAARGEQEETPVRKLESMKVSVDFNDVKLEEAVNYLRDFTGLNFVIDPRAAEKNGDARVSLKLRDVSVRSVLKLMLQPRELSATWKDGAIVVIPREEFQAQVSVRMYDVRAQLMKLQDFPGPRVELVSPTQSGVAMVGGSFMILDEPKVLIPEDVLVQLVRENAGARSWDENPHASITLANGSLIIAQTVPVHREIERLLGLLGQFK